MKKFLHLIFIFFLAGTSFAQSPSLLPPCNVGTLNQIAALPFTSAALTTCGQGDDITSTNASPVCGSSLYYGGEDVVYSFTPTVTGPMGINVTSTGTWMGLTVYTGCPVGASGVCVASAQSSAGNQSVCINVTAGTAYLVILDSWPSPTCNPFTLNISSCSGPPTPGNAVTTPSLQCATYTTNLSLNAASTTCGQTYQWQSGPSAGGPWTNIAGATASTGTANVTTTTYYRCILACGASTVASAAATASLTVVGACGLCNINSVTLPFSTTGQTNCGSGNNVTTTNVTNICGSSLYYGGEDAIYSFTPTTTGTVAINVTSTGSYMGAVLYQGCPVSGGTCVGAAQSFSGNQSLCLNLTAGLAYYLVLDSWPTPFCNPYDLDISGCTSAPPGGTAASASPTVCVSGGTIALSVTGSSTGTCGTTYQWQSAPVSAGPWTNVAGAIAGTYSPAITGPICFRRVTTCAAGTGTSTSVCVSVAACIAPVGGNAVATPTVACAAGGTVALSVTGSSSGCGNTYQWQSGPASTGPWTNIAGATTSVAAGIVNPPTTCFRMIISCGASSATSAAVCVSPGGSCISQLGTGVTSVAGLPYSTSGTTCGSGNDLTTANVTTSGCSSSSYLTGEDQVFVFTPTVTGNVTISLTSSGSYTGLMLYNTCPMTCAGSGGCIGSSTSSTGNKSLVVCVVAGTTYYLILDSFSAPACNPYSNLSISAPNSTTVDNDFCATPTPITPSGSFSGNTNTLTPDSPGNLASVFCGSIENNQWFSFVASASTATFGFSGISGTNCPAGVQGQVFSTSMTSTPCPSCTNFTSMSTPCYNPATTAAGTLTATGLTVGQTYYLMVDGNGGSQCNFTIGGWGITPLPVDLISFKGSGVDNKVNKLEWLVAQEIKLDHYMVQRSVDAINFTDLDKVYASGSSVSQKSYNYYDKSFERTINYYRLRIVDKDASYKYSSMVAINSDPNSKFKINKIFPNPANTIVYVSVDVPTDGELGYQVLDITGRVVAENKQTLKMGTGLLNIDLQGLSKGIYYLKFDSKNETKVEKFSLQ